jgi:hypothetical protein
MRKYKTGIVIGSYNIPDAVRLQLAVIRANCPQAPVIVSDDCSDGYAPTPGPGTKFEQIARACAEYEGVYLWPNVERIGHAGGDLSAFWKGLVWGKATGLEVVFKLSHRYVIDIPHWDQSGAADLYESGEATLGRDCEFHKWPIRTEAVGMRVDMWGRADIIGHLTPRKVNYPVEEIIFDDIRTNFGGKMCRWKIMSHDRGAPAPNILFREANQPKEYALMAFKHGLPPVPLPCLGSEEMENYIVG